MIQDELKTMVKSVVIGQPIELPDQTIKFFAPPSEEMLRIAPDGFYVRGVKLPQDENEAKALYDAFCAYLGSIGFQVKTP